MISYIQIDEDQPVPREIIEMGSRNHSRLQYTIARVVEDNSDLTAFPELSLDVSSAPFDKLKLDKQATLIPDVAFYQNIDIDWFVDEVRMDRMPLIAVEILSPYQGTQEFSDKFRLYFALGIKSCWLVSPALQSIVVLSPDMRRRSFNQEDTLVDEIASLQIPMSEIFR